MNSWKKDDESVILRLEFDKIMEIGVIRIGSQNESAKVGKISEQNGLKGLQVVHFECPRHSNPSVSSILGAGKFSQLPKLALWGNKNGLPNMKVKKLENFPKKWA